MNDHEAVIAALSRQIFACLRAQAQEEHFPQRDADTMDEVIARDRKTAAELRAIRQQYETLMAGALS
jgi:hypothetical protein